MHGHIQVTGRGSAQPGLTLAGQPNTLSVLDTRRYPHVDGAGTRRDSGAFALVAGVLDDRAAPPAVGARLGKAECALIPVDHTGAVARRTHLRAGTRSRAAAVAVRAGRRAGQAQRHCYAFGGLDKTQFGLGLQIVPAAWPAGTGTGAPPEQPAEQVADVGAAGSACGVEQIVQVELGAVTTHIEA